MLQAQLEDAKQMPQRDKEQMTQILEETLDKLDREVADAKRWKENMGNQIIGLEVHQSCV